MTIVTATPPIGVNKSRADFVKSKFDTLIWEKGYDVILEKSLRCPCVSKNSNQQSNCKNCGGTSWIFVNPKKTKVVMHSINMTTKFQSWSELNVGTASVSALAEDETSYMDRITALDGIAIFGEALFLKNNDNTYYFATIYDIKEITFLALFVNTSVVLKPLIYNIDFTYSGNKIILLKPDDYIDPLLTEQDISITVRYKHAPQFHIIDIPRETMQTFVNIAGSGEEEVNLPVHAVARRSHYVLDRQNFDNTRILDNSHNFEYNDLNPILNKC